MAYISVIIPCYNVEKYIDRCLNSLVNQTIGVENLEIIVVNDASTDDTLKKLKEWEEKYPDNILVITYDTNIRQGGARNLGLRYATSDYVGFVDSDDWIELDMYEILYSIINKGKFDVVKSKLTRDSEFPSKNTVCGDEEPRRIEYVFKKVGDVFFEDITDKGYIGEFGGIYTGIYNRLLIINNNLFFPERVAYEDNYWCAMMSLYVERLCIVDRIIYHYFVNPCSTVTARNDYHQLDRVSIEVAIVEAYKSIGAYELYKEKLEYNFVERFYLNTMFIVLTRFDFIPDLFPYLKRTLVELFPNYKENGLLLSSNIMKNPRNIALLRLLEIEPTLSSVQLDEFKNVYLSTFR